MSLSDCDHCWESPCICGYEYKTWKFAKKLKLAAAVLGLTPKQLKTALKDFEQYNGEYNES